MNYSSCHCYEIIIMLLLLFLTAALNRDGIALAVAAGALFAVTMDKKISLYESASFLGTAL